jgi:UPF0716 protein FxsA
MGLVLILIFVGLPILEIALFIEVGGAIGLLPTLGVILGTAVLGAAIVRWQGLRALDRLRASVATGADPVGPIAHGALILVAGALLVLPGFFTDLCGLLLLVPPVRAASYVRPGGMGRPDTIEADYEVVEDPGPRARGSGWTRPH